MGVKDEAMDEVRSVLEEYSRVRENLLLVEFRSVTDYLCLLQVVCEVLKGLNSNVMLYLAAAVSDFYIPEEALPEHKIQSSNGPLELSLQMVPKALGTVVSCWVPKAFVVSFKLETDENLLLPKVCLAAFEGKITSIQRQTKSVSANRLQWLLLLHVEPSECE